MTKGLEDLLPALPGVPPVFRVQDQGPLGTVGGDEAVHDVMQLTPETAILKRNYYK